MLVALTRNCQLTASVRQLRALSSSGAEQAGSCGSASLSSCTDAMRHPCSQYGLSHFLSRSAPGHRLMHARRDRPLQVRIPPVLQLGCQPRHLLVMGHNLRAICTELAGCSSIILPLQAATIADMHGHK